MRANIIKNLCFLILFLALIACDDSNKKKSSSSLPTSPKLSLLNPTVLPTTMTTPTLHITEVKDADQVSVYSDSICSQLMTTATVNGDFLDLVLPSLTSGTYQFYATRTAANATSLCSLEFVSYELDLNPPAISITLTSQTVGNINSTFEWSLNFSDASSITLSSSDIVLTGQTQGCVATVSGTGNTTRTVSVTGCSGQGSLNISVPANVAADALGNQSVLTTNVQVAVEIDNQAPQVTLEIQPASLVIQNNFNVKVSTDSQTTHYQYKFGVASSTDCSVSSGYSAWIPAENIWQESSSNLSAGNIKLCVVGKDSVGNIQTYANATTTNLIKDTTAADVYFEIVEREVNTGSGATQFTVKLSVAKAFDIKVFYVIEGDAIYGVDHNLLTNQTLTIPAGQTSVPLNVTIAQNNISSAGFALLRPKLIRTDNDRINIGTKNQSNLLIKYSGNLMTADQITSGGAHSCAIFTNGKLKCWGSNSEGQIGVGSSDSVKVNAVSVDSNVNYAQISAGTSHNCGITTAGVLKCWGNNLYGQLGIGSTTKSNVPVVVDSGVSYSFISASFYNTCGITTAGVLKCWGRNSDGQIGDGTNTQRNSPTIIESGVTYSHVGVGSINTCAITTSGVLQCWGANAHGQIGDGTTNVTWFPIDIDDGVSYSKVLCSESNTCAITSAGVLKCWGWSGLSKLGTSHTGDATSPIVVDSGVNYASLALGTSEGLANHACAITSAGVLKCWGYNSDGQLGDGTTNSAIALVVDVGVSYSKISAGGKHSCGITSSGMIKCWGANHFSQIGNGTPYFKSSPLEIDTNIKYSKIKAGDGHTCGVTINGTLKCWGSNVYGKLGYGGTGDKKSAIIIDSGIRYAQIESGKGGVGNHTCGITNLGDLKCWGYNADGQIGDGTTSSKQLPTIIDSGIKYSKMSLGDSFSCGITNSGVLKCWGKNNFGQLGDGTTGNKLLPTTIDTGVLYSEISAGDNHTCGVTSNNILKCWGYNSNGQIGDATSVNKLTPTIIESGVSYSKVGLGNNHSCGITSTGVLKCWGYNNYGELGIGSTTNKNVPTIVDSGTIYKSISSSNYHTCGITTNNKIKCWGNNSYGQIGDGTNGTNRTTPVLIDSAVDYNQVSVGEQYTCAITNQNVLKCWGYNDNSVLGDGGGINLLRFPLNIMKWVN
jgi:alpha-tubulin suppressor-like RCC1 family protein